MPQETQKETQKETRNEKRNRLRKEAQERKIHHKKLILNLHFTAYEEDSKYKKDYLKIMDAMNCVNPKDLDPRIFKAKIGSLLRSKFSDTFKELKLTPSQINDALVNASDTLLKHRKKRLKNKEKKKMLTPSVERNNHKHKSKQPSETTPPIISNNVKI